MGRPVAAWIIFALVLFTRCASSEEAPNRVTLGPAVAALNVPWRFHVGDDPHWADVDLDDSAWEVVDLTPKPGAHDDDVGLAGYVAGWSARGHSGYAGYAWYRMRIAVSAPTYFDFALTGPPYVDSAYQLFFNGSLLGGSGTFAGTPRVFGSQPRIFALPSKVSAGVLAIRVWASPGRIAGSPDSGGIHIAPAIGERTAIHDHYLLQWRQTFLGYVVDVITGGLLVLAALMAAALMPFDRQDSAYGWIIAALLLTAAIRFNQAVMFWLQIEDSQSYVLVRYVILVPLGFGAWTMAWLRWFRLGRPAWMPIVAYALTLSLCVAALLTGSWRPTHVPDLGTALLNHVSAAIRLAFAALLLLIAVSGVRQRRDRASALAMLAMATVGAGLFATELSQLHLQGVWFPFGVGVSRTEYSYVALTPMMFVLLLGRLNQFARAAAVRIEVRSA